MANYGGDLELARQMAAEMTRGDSFSKRNRRTGPQGVRPGCSSRPSPAPIRNQVPTRGDPSSSFDFSQPSTVPAQPRNLGSFQPSSAVRGSSGSGQVFGTSSSFPSYTFQSSNSGSDTSTQYSMQSVIIQQRSPSTTEYGQHDDIFQRARGDSPFMAPNATTCPSASVSQQGNGGLLNSRFSETAQQAPVEQTVAQVSTFPHQNPQLQGFQSTFGTTLASQVAAHNSGIGQGDLIDTSIPGSSTAETMQTRTPYDEELSSLDFSQGPSQTAPAYSYVQQANAGYDQSNAGSDVIEMGKEDEPSNLPADNSPLVDLGNRGLRGSRFATPNTGEYRPGPGYYPERLPNWKPAYVENPQTLPASMSHPQTRHTPAPLPPCRPPPNTQSCSSLGRRGLGDSIHA